MTSKPKRVMKDSQDRRKTLLAEPEIEIVEEYRVFCRICKKWIALDRRAPYKTSQWIQHKSTGAHSGTSNATSHSEHLTKDQRRQMLLDDPHAAKVEERRILCGLCHKWISLKGRYCLFSWRRHKLTSSHMYGLVSQPPIQDTLSGSKRLHSNRSSLDCGSSWESDSWESSSTYALSPNVAREDLILPLRRTPPSQNPGSLIDTNDSAVDLPDGDPNSSGSQRILPEPAPQAQSESLYADIVDYLKSHLTQSDDELRITALAMQELIRLGVLEPLE